MCHVGRAELIQSVPINESYITPKHSIPALIASNIGTFTLPSVSAFSESSCVQMWKKKEGVQPVRYAPPMCA